jgi:hypothetical protein
MVLAEGWVERSFKDSKSRFGLAKVQVGSPERLSRLLMALTIALSWLTLAALPEIGALPKGFHAVVSQRGRAHHPASPGQRPAVSETGG